MTELSRRNLLTATAAGGLLAASQAKALTGDPLSGTLATSDPGPHNPALMQQNQFAFTPEKTDHGNLGTLKYSFSEARNRRTNAGWAREVTVRNFPISKSMAGVNMRLEKGAVRELHWHLPSEWAYMNHGSARITAVDPHGAKFVADVKEGDLWFFPTGVPHSIQGLGDDGCEFILVFNDGNFSEDSTFLITDWFEHTSKEALAKNFGVQASTFDQIPQKELYIFKAPMPGSLASDLEQSSQPAVPNPYNFSLMDVKPIKTAGGTVRIADVNNFKASNTMCAALVEVEPGGMREMHWHPMSDEWQYYISGTARMTIFASEGRANTVDFNPSDVGYVPRTMGHFIENTGKDTLRFLEVFTTGQYSDVSLKNWMANTPHELVAAHLNLDENMLKALAQTKTPVVPG
jgi:oxalate decarboxylase